MYRERQVDLVAIRRPLTLRYRKFFESISKIANVNTITGMHSYLGMNIGTILAYTTLFLRSVGKLRPALMDINASVYTLLKGRKNVVVDFRTPLWLELTWLGHGNLALLAKKMEKIVQDRLAIAPNARMASLCRELGASSLLVIPNYPTRDFKATVKPCEWKALHGLAPDCRVVLFTGSETEWRFESIYGLDLLLESWQLVERSVGADLVILGNAPIDYVHEKMPALNIERIHLFGRVSLNGVANWISCADVCLAPRTPGFPRAFYDDKDSTKISEYAAFEKPIVAAGYAPSSQYLLVSQAPEAVAEGVMKGLDGKIDPPRPHFWEDNEPTMLRWLRDVWFGQSR